MDRARIAVGIGAINAEYLKHLYPKADQNDNNALAFGYEFIEKFIQLPFQLPHPTVTNILRMMGGEEIGVPSTPPDDYERVVGVVSGEDSKEIVSLAGMVAPLFAGNPRRIKQFTNVFRLRAHTCAATGLFDHAGDGVHWPLTTFRLAKFVALTLRWPLLVEELEKNPKLLTDMDALIWGRQVESSERPLYWLAKPGVEELFRERVKRGDARSEAVHSLANLNVIQLLETYPRVSEHVSISAGAVAGDEFRVVESASPDPSR